MKIPRPNSRERILAAAIDVAQEEGPGNLSLDAVAHRAGVSKGGLLYNFPTKAKLLQALVEAYLAKFDQAMEEAQTGNAGNESLLETYIRLAAVEMAEKQASSTWIFSAIAEDPDFLTPIKAFRRQLFDRLKAETPELDKLLVCYLAIEGMRSMSLFESNLLSAEERALLLQSLLKIAR
jgi:AcrR family transcriptional regulator